MAFVSLRKDVGGLSLYGFLVWSRDLPNMVMTSESQGNLLATIL